MTKLVKHSEKRSAVQIYADIYEKVKELAKEYNYSITAMTEYLLTLGMEDVECYQKQLEELANTPVKIVSSDKSESESEKEGE